MTDFAAPPTSVQAQILASEQAAADIDRAVRALRLGQLVGYPTEAVYGLGCDPANPQALERLLALKGRDAGKGFILIAADYQQLQPYLEASTALAQTLSANPSRATTWVVPAAPNLSRRLTGGRTDIAVRVTSHPAAAQLCRAFGGAITSTSANRSGSAALRSAAAVRAQFPTGLAEIIDAPLGEQTRPTRIVDWRTGATLRH